MAWEPVATGGGWELRAAGRWSKQAVSERAVPWAGPEDGKEASRELEKEPGQPQAESPGDGSEKGRK